MTKEEASTILEDVIDTLFEVGNGVTDDMLHEACDKLFKFRDEWFKKQNNICKPVCWGNSYGIQYHCPNCNFPENDTLTFDMKYCFNCGSNIDWSEWAEETK